MNHTAFINLFSICCCCFCGFSPGDQSPTPNNISAFKPSSKANEAKRNTVLLNASQLSCVTSHLQHIHSDHDMTDGDLLINTSCPTPRAGDVHSWLTLRDISPAALCLPILELCTLRKSCMCHIGYFDARVSRAS